MTFDNQKQTYDLWHAIFQAMNKPITYVQYVKNMFRVGLVCAAGKFEVFFTTGKR